MYMSPAKTLTIDDLRAEVVGLNEKVPLLDGTERRYIFLDNAAITPTFRSVVRAIEEFLPWYSGVHRGIGYKAVVATDAFVEAHRAAGAFVGADLDTNVVLFSKNATESINLLASQFSFKPNDVVVTTLMEHHSNDLPWRKDCRVVHVGVEPDGSVSQGALRDEIARHRGALRLVAVSGASNVTGICSPIHEIARWAHAAGSRIFVDAAQLAPHRPIDILPDDDPGHIDFLAFSAHKIYAPFGIGVLIGPLGFFEDGSPPYVGGGTVSYVGVDDVEWASPPHKDEAGSPNVVGAVALAESLSLLRAVGMDVIAEHEQKLLAYAFQKMKKLPRVTLYGPDVPGSDKVGVIPFTVDGLDHALVATILSTEGGIGVRNGNFCAQPYIRKLLSVTPEEEKLKRAARCDNPILPGMVRASLGCYNNEEDIDIFVELLGRIVRNEYRGTYSIDPVTGMYAARGFTIDSAKHLRSMSALRFATGEGEAA